MTAQSDRRWATALVGAILITLAAARVSNAQRKFETLVSFDGTNGKYPGYMSLVQGPDGNLYGTTYYGGADDCGTVFRLTPAGGLRTLYSFDYTYGCYPNAGLVLGTDGNLYGTAFSGNSIGGYGTVFKITLEGTVTLLYSFDGFYASSPDAPLVQGTDGDFYGTTELGGGPEGAGTVFKITPGGTLTTMYTFCSQIGCADGGQPLAALVQATDGNFYGTTFEGGTNFYGTVFKITPAGTLTTLHSFDLTDGAYPIGALVQAAGNFYGTTSGGGASTACQGFACGTVFKITPAGTLTTLHSFDSTDGSYPLGALVEAAGNFYGTTSEGGANGYGTVFKMASTGALTTLHSFALSDGAQPQAALVQSTNGSFYGATLEGGANSCDPIIHSGCGTLYRLTAGLSPFVEALPTSGQVGAAIKILGTNLTGASSVTFNGVSTAFKLVSPSEIETKVPPGATSGLVQVVTPGGTLRSNVPFRVIP